MNVQPELMLVLLPLVIVSAAIIAFCLVDIARRPFIRYLPKWAWALVCVFCVPLGAVVYLFIGRGTSEKLTDQDIR